MCTRCGQFSHHLSTDASSHCIESLSLRNERENAWRTPRSPGSIPDACPLRKPWQARRTGPPRRRATTGARPRPGTAAGDRRQAIFFSASTFRSVSGVFQYVLLRQRLFCGYDKSLGTVDMEMRCVDAVYTDVVCGTVQTDVRTQENQ